MNYKQIVNYATKSTITDFLWLTEPDDDDTKALKVMLEMVVRDCVKVGQTAFMNDKSTVPTFPAEAILNHFGIENDT
jgi:hypothetical protein